MTKRELEQQINRLAKDLYEAERKLRFIQVSNIVECGQYIAKWCMRLARVNVRWKDKYGQLRIEDVSIARTWYGFVKPGFIYYRCPRWLVHVDIYYGPTLYKYTGGYLIDKWQRFITKTVFKRAMAKWPEFTQELQGETLYL